MKKILGLDVGTSSVGWACIEHDFVEKKGRIIGLGSRILPMDQSEISDFNRGVLQSSTAMRTSFRGKRRLIERSLTRRKRLIKVLKILGFISEDFKVNHEHSWAWMRIDQSFQFRFEDSYQEMKKEFLTKHSDEIAIPHDWTIYYLRKKALTKKISKQELAWVILQFNTKRGYFQLRGDESLETSGDKYFINDIVDNILDTGEKSRGKSIYTIELREGIVGTYSSDEFPGWIGKRIDFIVTEKKLKDGSVSLTFTICRFGNIKHPV